MNVAIVLAAGIGSRTRLSIPKQFVLVNNKPIIIYTLETFQKHSLVDKICVVCLEGYFDTLRSYAKQFGIRKIEKIVTGGKTSQESIRNGVFALDDICQKDDVVVIHDGVRPMLNQDVLTDCIAKCNQYGAAASSLPYNEQLFFTDNGEYSEKYFPRDNTVRQVTPQAYLFGGIFSAYRYAFENNIGITSSSYANTMWVDLGNKIYLSAGSDLNIKITSAEDIKLFKSMIERDYE